MHFCVGGPVIRWPSVYGFTEMQVRGVRCLGVADKFVGWPTPWSLRVAGLE